MMKNIVYRKHKKPGVLLVRTTYMSKRKLLTEKIDIACWKNKSIHQEGIAIMDVLVTNYRSSIYMRKNWQNQRQIIP